MKTGTKRIIPFLLLIIYPYFLAVGLIVFIVNIVGSVALSEYNDSFDRIWFNVMTYSFLITIIVTVVALIHLHRKDENIKGILFMNMLIKLLHIPTYGITFVVGLMFASTGVGIILSANLFIVDSVTIFLSGMIGLSGIRKMKKEGIFSSKQAVKFGICQFIFCVDAITCVVLYVKCTMEALSMDRGQAC